MRFKTMLVLLGLASAVEAAAPTTQPVNVLAPVGQGLLAVAEREDATDERLRVAITAARDALPTDAVARAKLDTLLAGELDQQLAADIARDIAFTPSMEAPTPRGWPAFTPVGEVRLQQYPKYRIAYVDRGDTLKGGEFFTLFFHIERNNIAMTAPVEMKMTDGDKPSMKQMAFLYENTDMGKLGQDNKVTVVDVEPLQAISVGGRGDWSGASMERARSLIDAWMTTHPDYVAADDLRVFGYNSPQMPKEKRYHEVQLPVKKR